LIEEGREVYVAVIGQLVETLHEWEGAENLKAGRGRTKQSPFTTEHIEPTLFDVGSPHTRNLRRRAGAFSGQRSPRKGEKRRGRPPGVTHGPEHWQRVAELYKQARVLGKNPTEFVAEKMPCGWSTAATWISRCRRMDPPLLPPTTQGKATS